MDIWRSVLLLESYHYSLVTFENLKYFLIWVPKASNDCTSVVGSRGRNVMSMILLDTRHLSSQSKWTSGGQ